MANSVIAKNPVKRRLMSVKVRSTARSRTRLRPPLQIPVPDTLPLTTNPQFDKTAADVRTFGSSPHKSGVHLRDAIATAISAVQQPAKAAMRHPFVCDDLAASSSACIATTEELNDQDLQQSPAPCATESTAVPRLERSIDPEQDQSAASNNTVLSGSNRSMAKRLLRVVARGLVTLAVVVVVIAAFSYENEFKRDFAAARDLSAHWLSSTVVANAPAASDVKTATASPSEAPDGAIKPISPAGPPTVSTAALAPSQLRLDTIESDVQSLRQLIARLTAGQTQMAGGLATLQRRADELAARQDQLTRELATLQDTQATVIRKLELLQSEGSRPRPHKRMAPRRREPVRPAPSFPSQ